jgi:hypothetical protein
MFAAYGLIALLGWAVLVLSFCMMHASERTTSEVIRDLR